MIRYLDTSLLVSAVWDENSTVKVQKFLRLESGSFAISDWSLTEFAAAIEGKTRGGAMIVDQRDAARLWFRSFVEESAELLPVDRLAFRRAASIAATPGVLVRAGDALHLAVAEAQGAVMCTLDREQAKAGEMIGMSVQFLSSAGEDVHQRERESR